MNNTSSKNDRFEMNKKAEEFRVAYGQYLNGNITDEELSDITTQPFWQSMHLSKKRLDKLGLKMDVKFNDDSITKTGQDNILSFVDSNVNITADGTDITGSGNMEVKTCRQIFRGNKKIFKKNNKEILHTHFIKSNITGDMAVCPNCGHSGKISSFIDGCDFCGAKYLVSDFNTKISGFSIEDNIGKKIITTYKNSFKTIVLISVIIFLAAFFSFSGLFNTFNQQVDNNRALKALLPIFFSLAFLPAFIKSIFIFIWFFISVVVIVNIFYKKDIVGSEKVSCVINDFSAASFAQSIELELKNIHFSDSEKQITTFTLCNIKDLIKKYQNVVDCNLIRIKFLDAKKINYNEVTGNNYVIDAEIKMRVFYDNGRRIKSKNEKIICSFSGNDVVINKPTYILREYKCPKCGTSVNVLDGGICENCGTKIDYSKFGWLINKYESKFEISNLYKNIHIGIVAFFIGVLSISLKITSAADDYKNINNFNMIYDIAMYSNDLLDIMFGMAPTPENMDTTINQTQCITSYSKRYAVYQADYSQYIKYIEFLKENGYSNYSKDINIEENSAACSEFKKNTADSIEKNTYAKYINSSEVIDYIEHHTSNRGIINLANYDKDEDYDGNMLIQVSYNNSCIHVFISLDE